MKPAFALNITDDRISLLHRTSSGWLEVGGVGLDSAEIGETISYLRSTAQTLDPRGLTCKVVIPNSQILYLSVEAPGPDAASRRTQIRAGLEGRTPYAVDDLVFDWWGKGDTVQVAVVARETLDEAEAFAVAQKLNPMSFVAIPPTSEFGGEPWFGQTAFAPTLLGPGEKIERDQDPVHIVGRATIPQPAPAPIQTAIPEEPVEAVIPDEDADEPMIPAAEDQPAVEADPEPEAPFSEVEDSFEEVEVLPAVTATEIVEPPLDALPEPPVEVAAEAEPALAVTDQKAMKRAAAAAVRNSRAAARAEPPRVPPAPPRAPAIGPATRPAAKATRPAAEAISPLEQVTATVKARGESGKTKAAGAMVTAQTIAVPKERRHAPAPEATPALAPQQRTEGQVEAEAMTVFGARRGSTRGKPKYLGLILTAILLAFLAAVAAWSSIYLASWINPDAPRVETADATGEAAAPPATEPGTDQAVADGTAVDATTDQAATDLPSAEDEALADGEDIGPATEQVPADAAAPDAAEAGDAAPADEVAAAPADEVAAAPTDEVASAVPADAATVATDTARNPGDEPQDEIFLSTAAPAPATSDAIALAAPPSSPDVLPPAQPDPPPFGTTYQFDAAGRIIPTKEGIITPEGVMLVAGKPPIVPPQRPAIAASAAAPAAATDALSDLPATATEAAAPAQIVDPALAKLKPKLRPEGLVPPKTAGQDDDGAALPAATDTRMASLHPRARPASVFAANNAALEAEKTSAASDASLVTAALEDGSSPLAVAVSRKPAPRPLVTDSSIENAVAEAATMTVALPEPKPAAEPTLALALPEPEPEPVAQPAPKAGKKAAAAPSDDATAVESDEADAKEAAPNLPTKANVAKKATFANAINLSKTNLIGVYGTPSNRYALVRQSTGRFVKVEVGDRLDGGQVAAITQSELRYVKNGQTVTLSMPRG